jgi:hypothetical protein
MGGLKMKCDELQERWFEAYPVEGDQIIPTKVYGKKDADDAIAELKDKLWISVGIIRPEWGKIVKVKFKDGSEDECRFSHDYKWVSKGMATCEAEEVTHWMPKESK